jgi:hypothetical protein
MFYRREPLKVHCSLLKAAKIGRRSKKGEEIRRKKNLKLLTTDKLVKEFFIPAPLS